MGVTSNLLYEKQGICIYFFFEKADLKIFAEAIDGEMERLVDNFAQTNTKKSTKYTGMIFVRSP